MHVHNTGTSRRGVLEARQSNHVETWGRKTWRGSLFVVVFLDILSSVCFCFVFCFVKSLARDLSDGLPFYGPSHLPIVQFSSRWHLCARKSPYYYALHPVSQKFPQRCISNGSNVRLIDDGPLSSFQ